MTEEKDPPGEDTGQAGEPSADSKQLRPRFAVDFDLTLDSDTYFYAGSATNLSTGGFFVATHILQNIGDKFKFTVRLPETNRLVRGIGEVRWHRHKDESPEAPAGMGIRFVELEEGGQLAIDEYLATRKPVRWDND